MLSIVVFNIGNQQMCKTSIFKNEGFAASLNIDKLAF